MLEDRLKKMLGKPYLYDSRRQVVQNFKIDRELETVTIVTDKRWYDFPVGKIKDILNDFLPAEEERSVALATTKNGTFETLASAIQGNIKKIQQGKEVDLGKLKAVNDSVNTLVNLAKLELQLRKAQMKE